MSVTIKDIARIANVSHTTVSRALNDSPLINKATKERIKAIAKQLNYTPNFNAKSLVLDRSYNIGLFFSTLNTGTSASFFYETVRGVNGVIGETYNLVVRGIDDYDNFAAISRKSFDGVIVMSQSSADDPFIQHLEEASIPHVVLNRKVQGEHTVNIVSDDRQGAYKAVEYLIRQGHRRIAVIEGKEGFESTRERTEGYLQALEAHGITPNPAYRIQGSYDLRSGYFAMKQLLSTSPMPTAVFCLNDDMAVGAIKAIVERKMEVPRHVSVVGFDDSMFSEFLTPSLTTVKRPIEQISRTGAAKLLELVENQKETVSRDTIYLNTELVIRESAAAPTELD